VNLDFGMSASPLDASILSCLDASTGESKWKGASGHLIVVTEAGALAPRRRALPLIVTS
jgi:hypothetical protein